MKITGNVAYLKVLVRQYGDAKVELVCEMQELETKAWLALQKGHYKMFGKLAAKWNQVNYDNKLFKPDPFMAVRKLAERVRV